MRNHKRFTAEAHGERFVLKIHTENLAHEARIRWEIPDRNLSGKWARLYLPESMPGGSDQVIQDPTLTFNNHEPIMLGGRERRSINLSRSLGLRLQESLDDLGTATVEKERICDDPSQFPSTIHYQTKISTEHLDKSWWESGRYLMWYTCKKSPTQNVPSRMLELVEQLDMYGYQIKNEELIHRANEFPSESAVNELKEILQQTDAIMERDTDLDSRNRE